MGPKTTPGRIIAGQAGVTLIGAAVWSLLGGGQAAVGATVGGVISVVLSLYFAIKVFSQQPDAGPDAMFRTFVRAEALKLVLAAVLFSAAAIFLRDVWVPLITTFIATLGVYWFALLWTRYDPPGFGHRSDEDHRVQSERR